MRVRAFASHYICSEMLTAIYSSSGRMPQAVRQALTDVFQNQGHMALPDAEMYLAKMEKEGRYKQETW
jgi:sulfite reductase alpha subunit-like flavoprotein